MSYSAPTMQLNLMTNSLYIQAFAFGVCVSIIIISFSTKVTSQNVLIEIWIESTGSSDKIVMCQTPYKQNFMQMNFFFQISGMFGFLDRLQIVLLPTA